MQKKREWSMIELSKNKEKSFNKSEYNNNFAKENYDRIAFQAKKGKKEELKRHIFEFGYKSMNDFINKAVDEKIERDLENF